MLYKIKYTMSPCGKIPKSVAQSQLKMCLYESFENHWHTMVWLNKGSKVKADIWWDDTIEWLEHVSLENMNQVVGFGNLFDH